jgi:hypothetical protein
MLCIYRKRNFQTPTIPVKMLGTGFSFDAISIDLISRKFHFYGVCTQIWLLLCHTCAECYLPTLYSQLRIRYSLVWLNPRKD